MMSGVSRLTQSRIQLGARVVIAASLACMAFLSAKISFETHLEAWANARQAIIDGSMDRKSQ